MSCRCNAHGHSSAPRLVFSGAGIIALGLLLSGDNLMHAQGETQVPTLVSRSPLPSATGVSTQITVRAIFSEPIQPATLSFELRNASNAIVPAASSYDNETQTHRTIWLAARRSRQRLAAPGILPAT
jgi:hypothetical protein